MDYENKLRDIINSRHTPFFDIDILCKYFPELKENKDKIIRNRIIGYLKLDIEEHPERQERLNEMIAYFEKLCEQTPTDNIEPKFHEGDFIKHNRVNIICKVISVNSGSYYVRSINTSNGIELFHAEQNFHLWTIQDAKDGDVLTNGKIIVIFKHFEEPSYRQNIVSYIGLDTIGNVQITDGTWNLGIDKTKPATKEQRDLLFQKIKEAGYEWNAEKKEISKIENEPALSEEQSTPQIRTGIEWVNTIDDACDKRYSEEYAHGEYCHEQSFKWGFQEGVDWLEEQDKKNPTDEGMIEALRTEYEKGRADAITEMQSRVLSANDKNILNAIIYTVQNSGYKHCIGVSNETMISWLKALKESCGRGTL